MSTTVSSLQADLRFLTEVAEEVDRARKNYPDMHSLHEGYAVILEELEEFWAEAKLKPHERDPGLLRRELIQVAAMAVRTATDVLGGGDGGAHGGP